MSYIVSYRKFITRSITVQLTAPEESTELCTIAGVTYVSVPDGLELATEQPSEIADTIKRVTLTDDLRESIKEKSTHVWLIDNRVKDKIAERYSLTDELKMLRMSPSIEFDAYNAYVEVSRAWGRDQKAALGLRDN